VVVDIGLPDAPGTGLIRDLARGGCGAPAVIAISGDPDLRAEAMAAGAAAFAEKPIPSLAAFQLLILAHLPDRPIPMPAAEGALPTPDPLALRDDLARAAQLIDAPPGSVPGGYVARFVAGIARVAGDPALERAARRLPAGGDAARADLCALLAERLDHAALPFARQGG
jgi:CheY-like chemotaxis protein